MSDNPYRQLPSVHDVLRCEPLPTFAIRHGRERTTNAVRTALAELREQLRRGEVVDGEMSPTALAATAAERLNRDERTRLRSVLNATGIVLHTNLGRAPLAEESARAALEAGQGYLNLELDLETGQRSSRQNAIRDELCRLTGAESATAVNNNAAATVLVLRTLCAGKEVILSRGQLIEIGGSFRIPEILAVSGAVLREVGTTNITRLSDYERAISPATGALMRIHPSNYRVGGFTHSTPLTELTALGKKHGLPVIDDVGSGALIDFRRLGFTDEPIVRESVAAGADLVLFSGDKLLGGPQTGVIVGRRDLIQRLEKDPLMRAFRLDKMTLAALAATLRLYRTEEGALRSVPVLRMLAIPVEELRRRAEALALALADVVGLSVRVREDEAFVGGGSLPEQTLPSWVVEMSVEGASDAELALRLRRGEPAVVTRVSEGRVIVDVRTVLPGQDAALIDAIRTACDSASDGKRRF